MFERTKFVATIIVSSIGLVGCATESAEPITTETISAAKASIAAESTLVPTSSPTSTSDAQRTLVIWSDYESGTKDEIDKLTIARDCLGLSSFVGMSAATEESIKAKTGHGNEALSTYLAESLAIANCQ